MAIMAGEAITEGGTSGLRGASRARRARTRGAPGERLKSRRVVRRTPIEGEIGGTQTETEMFEIGAEPEPELTRRERYQQQARQRARSAASGYGRQAREVGRTAQITGRSSHQGAILAEFIVAILIIVLTPIATGGSGGLSPYTANDLKRMVAIGAVYFGLALVPGDNGSKVAAWLGFLILVVLLMNALQSGHLATLLDVFSQGGSEPPGATSPTG